MEFFVDEKKIEISSNYKTLGEVLSWLDERAEAMNSMICEVKKDGKAVDADHLADIFQISVTDASKIELLTKPVAGIKEQAITALLDLVKASIETLDTEDSENTKAALNAWNSYVTAFSGVFSAEEESFIEAFKKEFETSLQTKQKADIKIKANEISTFFSDRLGEIIDPISAMLSTSKLFDAIKEDLSLVPVKLQTGKDAEAMKTMVMVVELLNKTVRILPNYTVIVPQKIIINGEDISGFYSSLNDVLKELAQAFEGKDSILIGDLAEYEIKPRMEAFFEAIKLSAGRNE